MYVCALVSFGLSETLYFDNALETSDVDSEKEHAPDSTCLSLSGESWLACKTDHRAIKNLNTQNFRVLKDSDRSLFAT